MKTHKGVCAQYKHNKTCGCVCVCVCVDFSPCLKSSTLAITSYQGLDEGEGIYETQRWKEVRAEKEGSRFSGRTEKGENRD